MSDVPPLGAYLQWKLSIATSSLAYAGKSTAKNALFAVDIPYPLLRAWYSLVVLKKPLQSPSEATTSVPILPNYTFIELLEYSIPGHSFAISRDNNIRSEVNKSLLRLASKVHMEYYSTRGRKRMALDSRSKKFHIFEGQVISVEKLQQECQMIYDEQEKWKNKCKNLESDLQKLYSEMEIALNEKDKEISDLSTKNEELLTYIETLEKSQDMQFKGKDISEVTKKSRTLKKYLSRANVALWFSKSFGLEVESLIVREVKSGVKHNVITSKTTTDQENDKGFDALSDDDKSKVEKVLFLLDRFCVGDNFYHELSMVIDGLPKSYLVKQRRSQLNDLCHISPLPGEQEGAQVSFKLLLKERVQHHVTSHQKINSDGVPLRVKISGDGANMTRSSNYILMTFALLDASEDIMAAKGNHTIAVVRGKEDYDTLKDSFKDVFQEINEMVAQEKIAVNEGTVNLEFFLGGDYKFILLMMGLSGATSNHACVWCNIHKDKRWDMSHDLEYYNSPPLKRTLKDMHSLAGKTKQNYCCVHKPLLDIELSHVILDELHLLLRVMDILIGNLVQGAIDWDKKDNWKKKKSEHQSIHVNHLVEVIKSCGVTFNVWEKVNADKQGSGLYDFTSLLGTDKKKLLKELPEKLDGLIPDHESTVKLIWQKFSTVYAIVTCKDPSDEMIADYFLKAKEWVNLFISLHGKVIGHKRANVTPYMHAMVYHIPKVFQMFKSIKIFTGQGVEKNNDVARSTVLKKSNKWDGPADVLKHEARLWELKERERPKRNYDKNK